MKSRSYVVREMTIKTLVPVLTCVGCGAVADAPIVSLVRIDKNGRALDGQAVFYDEERRSLEWAVRSSSQPPDWRCGADGEPVCPSCEIVVRPKAQR